MLCLLKFIILAFHIHFISTKMETFIATVHCIHSTCIFFFGCTVQRRKTVLIYMYS